MPAHGDVHHYHGSGQVLPLLVQQLTVAVAPVMSISKGNFTETPFRELPQGSLCFLKDLDKEILNMVVALVTRDWIRISKRIQVFVLFLVTLCCTGKFLSQGNFFPSPWSPSVTFSTLLSYKENSFLPIRGFISSATNS